LGDAVTSSSSSVGSASALAIFGAHLAAGDGPLVVLFGEHGPDETGDRGTVGEDADDVGATADLLVGPSSELLSTTAASAPCESR
jgi:hypothetical protein